MTQSVASIPAGYEGVTPYLICKNADAAIDFYTKAFGAVELFRIGEPGMIGHCEMQIGNAIFMLADEYPENGALGPLSIGGTSVQMMVYVEDVDTFTEKAKAAGMSELRAVETMFYGDRSGHFRDPFGHVWIFATHVEDVSPEEMKVRAAAIYGGEGSQP